LSARRPQVYNVVESHLMPASLASLHRRVMSHSREHRAANEQQIKDKKLEAAALYRSKDSTRSRNNLPYYHTAAPQLVKSNKKVT
jgi:hypothetical protein